MYEQNDFCPSYGGDPFWVGDMGSVTENCCYCIRPPCEDTPNWTDGFGDGCDWYEDSPGSCGTFFFYDDDDGTGTGDSANDNCCVCKYGFA